MTADEFLRSCISLSNDGALLMEHGMYERAIHKLTSALQVCRKYCAQQPTSSCNKTRNINNNNESVRFDLDVLMATSSSSLSSRGKQIYFAAGTGSSSKGYIYQRPIQVPKLLEECCRSVHLVMTVVCFNLGIAYHIQASKGNSNNNNSKNTISPKTVMNLKKALQLYKTAEKMQRQSSNSSKALFQSALMNNVGHIFTSLGQTELSGTYYSRLLSLILYMITFKKLDAKYYDDYLNFLLPKQRTCASAA